MAAYVGNEAPVRQRISAAGERYISLKLYTHVSYDCTAEQMAKIIDFKEDDMQGKLETD